MIKCNNIEIKYAFGNKFQHPGSSETLKKKKEFESQNVIK